MGRPDPTNEGGPANRTAGHRHRHHPTSGPAPGPDGRPAPPRPNGQQTGNGRPPSPGQPGRPLARRGPTDRTAGPHRDRQHDSVTGSDERTQAVDRRPQRRPDLDAAADAQTHTADQHPQHRPHPDAATDAQTHTADQHPQHRPHPDAAADAQTHTADQHPQHRPHPDAAADAQTHTADQHPQHRPHPDAAAGAQTQAVDRRTQRRPDLDAAAGAQTQAVEGHRRPPRRGSRGAAAEPAGEQAKGRRRGDVGTPTRQGTANGAEAGDPNGVEATTRVKRIDETLTRLTAAHAGLTLGAGRDEPADTPADTPPTRRPNLLRLAALAVATMIVAAAGVGWGAQRWLGAAVPAAAALDPGSGAIVDAPAQVGDENVLLVATDRAATPGATARPDTVVVAHLPAGNGPLTVLAIPADLEVARPPCERYDAAAATYTSDTVPAQARTQLASALDLGGPRCATRAVQQLTGLAITRYVGVDLAHLGDAVDALSGVRFCTPRAVVDATLGPVVPTPGTISLDARRATDFARAADVAGDPTAGRGRIERQQQVLAAVLGATLSSPGLLDLPRVAALRPALGHALTTDAADLDQVLALARRPARSRRERRDVHRRPHRPRPRRPGLRAARGRGGRCLRGAAHRRAAARHGSGRERRAPAVGPHRAGGERLRPPRARREDRRHPARARLPHRRRHQRRQPTPQTLIRYSPDQTAAAQLLAATVPAATTVPDPGATGVLQLVLGRSFDGVVRAPTTTPPGSADPPPAAPPH